VDITELLTFTQKQSASDLHLSSGQPPILRVDGDIAPLRVAALSAEEVTTMLHSVMNEKQRSDYELNLEIDFAMRFGDNCRFRVNAFYTVNGPAAVFRLIPNEVVTLRSLKMPDILTKLTYLQRGIILVTGPTGSGKSTTLAAMVNHINESMPRHIITVEDPIEFIHTSKRALINQRELGSHTLSFARALKSALREDPDVILVGELRDLETIKLALTAAETGHLVMGTLHTSSAAKTIDRIIDVFPPHDKEMVRSMLAGSIEAIISQALLKRAEGAGRVAAYEILLATPAVRNLVRENKIAQIQSLIQVGSKKGMITMRDCIYGLLEKGLISNEMAKMTIATLMAESDTGDDAGLMGNKSGIPGVF
jgi:twitching motility protein PilT